MTKLTLAYLLLILLNYQNYILANVFKEGIPSLYPNNLLCVKFHQDKVTSHTSKSTAIFLEKKKNEMGETERLFQLKVSHPSPPTCLLWITVHFDLNKAVYQQHHKKLYTLYKIVVLALNKIKIDILRKALLLWK